MSYNDIRATEPPYPTPVNQDDYDALAARLADAMMYLRECHSLLVGDQGGFIPAGMVEFLRAADSASAVQK